MSHWFNSLPAVLITLSRLSWSGFRRIEAPGSALLAIFFDKIKTWIKWRRRLKMSLQKTNFQTKYKLSFSAKGNTKRFFYFVLKIWQTQRLNEFDVGLTSVRFLRFNQKLPKFAEQWPSTNLDLALTQKRKTE